jgi:hypothetical protein
MKNTIREIKEKLSAESSINDDKKAELMRLLDELGSAMGSVDSTEHAHEIAGHIKRSTEAVIQEEKDPALIDKAIGDLKDSVTEFEVSHPKLFENVNNISAMLASMGI